MQSRPSGAYCSSTRLPLRWPLPTSQLSQSSPQLLSIQAITWSSHEPQCTIIRSRFCHQVVCPHAGHARGLPPRQGMADHGGNGEAMVVDKTDFFAGRERPRKVATAPLLTGWSMQLDDGTVVCNTTILRQEHILIGLSCIKTSPVGPLPARPAHCLGLRLAGFAGQA